MSQLYVLPTFVLSDPFKEKWSKDSFAWAPFQLFGILTIFKQKLFLKV